MLSTANVGVGTAASNRPIGIYRSGLYYRARCTCPQFCASVGTTALHSAAWKHEVLIVDGTNLQFYTKPSTRAISHAASFKAWLRFLSAATGADAVIVVFDRKGERQGVMAVRQTAAPQYLQARRKKQGLVHPIAAVLPESDAVQAGEHTPLHAKPAAADSAPQPGLLPEMWSQHTSNDVVAAGAVSADLATAAVSTAASRYTVKSIGGRSTNKGKDGFAAAAQALGCLVVYGVAAYEADDSIASLVHHLAHAQSPPPSIAVVSADSDMQALMAWPHVAWLELKHLASVASSAEAHVSIMQVHTLPGMTALPLCLNRAPQLGYNPACPANDPAAEQAAQGSPHLVQGYLPAACYKDYLALVGKPEAGVRGVGISANAARTLLKRFGSLEGIVHAVSVGRVDERLRIQPPTAKVKQPMGQPDTATKSHHAIQHPLLQQALTNRSATQLYLLPPEAVQMEAVLQHTTRHSAGMFVRHPALQPLSADMHKAHGTDPGRVAATANVSQTQGDDDPKEPWPTPGDGQACLPLLQPSVVLRAALVGPFMQALLHALQQLAGGMGLVVQAPYVLPCGAVLDMGISQAAVPAAHASSICQVAGNNALHSQGLEVSAYASTPSSRHPDKKIWGKSLARSSSNCNNCSISGNGSRSSYSQPVTGRGMLEAVAASLLTSASKLLLVSHQASNETAPEGTQAGSSSDYQPSHTYGLRTVGLHILLPTDFRDGARLSAAESRPSAPVTQQLAAAMRARAHAPASASKPMHSSKTGSSSSSSSSSLGAHEGTPAAAGTVRSTEWSAWALPSQDLLQGFTVYHAKKVAKRHPHMHILYVPFYHLLQSSTTD